MPEEDVEMQAYHKLLSRLLAVSKNPAEDHAILSGEGWQHAEGFHRLEERNRLVASLNKEQREIALAWTKELYAQGVATALDLLEDYQITNSEGVCLPHWGDDGSTMGDKFVFIYAYGRPYNP